MTDELKPCPFEHPDECTICNHLVSLHVIENNTPRCIEGHECDCISSFDPVPVRHAENGKWSVICTYHGTDGPISETEEQAIAAWNKRGGNDESK